MNLEELVEALRVWNLMNGNVKMVSLLDGEITIKEYIDGAITRDEELIKKYNKEIKEERDKEKPNILMIDLNIKYLNKIYNLDLETAKLLDHAKEIEEEIAMMIERQRERTDKEKDHPPYYG